MTTTQPSKEDVEKAEKTLKDFVNDHNEVVRWLRNQDPYEVAEALAKAITQAKAEGAERMVRERELAAKAGLCVALAHLNNSKTVRQAIEGINREIDEFDRQSLQEEKLTNPEG